MAGLINLRLLTDFFNKIDPNSSHKIDMPRGRLRSPGTSRKCLSIKS